MFWKTLCLAASLAAFPIFAVEPIRVNVPFDFSADGQHWSAGDYQLTFPAHSVVLIRNLDRSQARMVMIPGLGAGKPDSDSKLVFNRYGDSYFLSQVWSLGQGGALPKSANEREIAKRSGGSPIVATIHAAAR